MSGRKKPPSKHEGALLASLRRKRGLRTLPERHLIVCEDGKSARSYFEALKRHFKLDATSVQVARGSHRSAPGQVVARALELKDGAESPDSGTVPFDRVWCVVDGDYGRLIGPARTTARRHDIEVIVSTPCFEYWVLLHFEDSAKSTPKCKDAETLLKKHAPRYQKGSFDFGSIIDRAMDASTRAARHRRTAGASTLPENQNPCSEIYRLVDELKEKI